MEEQLHLLASLARIDGDLDESERDMIISIGKALNVDENRIEEILREPDDTLNLEGLTEDAKFEYLVNLVQLMKIDGKIYNGEIMFCQEVAERLGYRKELIMELYQLIYTNPAIRVPDSMIRDTIKAHMEK